MLPTVKRKIYTQESEEELLDMGRDEASEGLSDKEILFCEYFMGSYNVKMSAVKAGYKGTTANLVGYKLRNKPKVNKYICWLKLKVSKRCNITAMDIVEKYMRIAFSDMTDFVKIENNRIKLYNGSDIDGQLIKTVRQGKDGVTIELYDKLVAFDRLERYFDVMPRDWRQKIEEQKLELMRQRVEIEKKKAGQFEDEEQDDGFIEALKGSVKEVWELAEVEDGEEE